MKVSTKQNHGPPDPDSLAIFGCPVDKRNRPVPKGLLLNYPPNNGPGITFGVTSEPSREPIGMMEKAEGNAIVIGSVGAGKSFSIARQTLESSQHAIFALDVKGELSAAAIDAYKRGLIDRPPLVIDFMDPEGPSYDPFGPLRNGTAKDELAYMTQIGLSLFPDLPTEIAPFWTKAERNFTIAALFYFYRFGLSFSEALVEIHASTVSELCVKMRESGIPEVRYILGQLQTAKLEFLANIDAGVRSQVSLLATDPYITHLFRGSRENAHCVSWEDNLKDKNIFLRIPEEKIEPWGKAIVLIIQQLILQLMERPDMYTPAGKNMVPVLLLLDEFPRFGKLEKITESLATLRSKKVNFCLMIQSVAQLDRLYGKEQRQVIFDNCQFKVILRANDPETQMYLSDLIGTHVVPQRSISRQRDTHGNIIGYSEQIYETREHIVQPHELATLDDVIILSPYGMCRAEKIRPGEEIMDTELREGSTELALFSRINTDYLACHECDWKNKGAKIMSITEREKNAKKRMDEAIRQNQLRQRREEEEERRKDRRRNSQIGELVTKYFPSLKSIEPGTTAEENRCVFEKLEAFLFTLSIRDDLIEEVQNSAEDLLRDDSEGNWRQA